MTDVCHICEEALNNLPCTELLCHHKYHTQCFLTNVATGMNNIDMIQCVVCHMALFPEEESEEEQEQEQEQEQDQQYIGGGGILTLFDTNEQFRQDLKSYVKACEASSKPRIAFHKLLREKKREFKEVSEPHFVQIKTLWKTKKDQVVQSDTFKEYKKTDMKSRRLYKYLKETYDINSHNVQFLRSKPGMRRLHPLPSYSRSPIRMIQKWGWSLRRRIRI